ncbi:MAG TPA: glycerol-3-phosphate 1-O-acyltransferase PlsY [Gemmatimonadales bacterium]|nr:glycerol-3-phosphate 1-O-acyltransferase PlsY [Gemmatimonadales bacterium]
MMSAFVWLLLSYLVGALPTSYLAARVFGGIDLREHGSRNLGATNVYRVLGWKYAIPVGLVDVAKGALPVWLFGERVPELPLFPLFCGLAAVVGHGFSVFVGFRGGKGVATAAGVVLALAPWALLAVTVVWVLVVWLTGYVSLGSVVSAALFPLAAWLLHDARGVVLVSEVALAGFIIWKHRANLLRLAQGTENRFGRRARPAATPGSTP